MTETNVNFSSRILLRLILLGAIALVLLIANFNFINELYFTRQLTMAGYVINGSIFVVFVLGLVKIILSLLRYMREEAAIEKMVSRLESQNENPAKGVSVRSIIARRYNTLRKLSEKYARINHSALASTLLASESTRTSFARYVSNILILTGVFGTIVSLSIALAGASDLLDNIQGSDNMGLVIHGMSTALSTTTTAIVCYLFFGYFYLKTTDAQTQLLSGIEQATTLYIMPRFTYQTDSILHEVGNLVRALREAAENLGQVEADFAEAGNSMNEMIGGYADSAVNLDNNMDEIKQLLRNGFRLPE